jgi:hypothetical protein
MTQLDTCRCLLQPRRDLALVEYLGMDSVYAEVSILVCPDCGRRWLRYFYELEAFSRSGRWYLGLLSDAAETRLDVHNAREILAQLAWYFYGGSYYGGRSGKTSGAIPSS